MKIELMKLISAYTAFNMSRPCIYVTAIPQPGVYSEGYPEPSERAVYEYQLGFAVSPNFHRIDFHPHGQVIVWLARPVVEWNAERHEHEFLTWESDGSHSYMPHKSPWVHIRDDHGKKIGQFPVYYFPEFPDPPKLELRWPPVYYEIFGYLHFTIGAEETWRLQSLTDEEIVSAFADLSKHDPMIDRIIKANEILEEARKLGYHKWCDWINTIGDFTLREIALHELVDHVLEKCKPQTVEYVLGHPTVLVEPPPVIVTTYQLALEVITLPPKIRLSPELGMVYFQRNLRRLQKSKRRPTHYLHDTAIRIGHMSRTVTVKPSKYKLYPFDEPLAANKIAELREWRSSRILEDVARPVHRHYRDMAAMLKSWDNDHRFDVFRTLFYANLPDDIGLVVRFHSRDEKFAEAATTTLETPGRFTQGVYKMFDLLNGSEDHCAGTVCIFFTKDIAWGKLIDHALQRTIKLRGVDLAPKPNESSHLGDNEPEKMSSDSDDDSSIKSVASEEADLPSVAAPAEKTTSPRHRNKPSDCFNSCYVIAKNKSFRILKVISIPPAPGITYTTDHTRLFLNMVMQMDGMALMETDVTGVRSTDGKPVDPEYARRYIADMHRMAVAKIHARWYNVPSAKELADTFRHMDMVQEQMMLENEKVNAMNTVKNLLNDKERTRRAGLIELSFQLRIAEMQIKYEARAYADYIAHLDSELQLHEYDLLTRRNPPRGIDEKMHKHQHYKYKDEMVNKVHALKVEELEYRFKFGEFTEKQYTAAVTLMEGERAKLHYRVLMEFYPNRVNRHVREKLKKEPPMRSIVDGIGNILRVPK